MSSELESVLRAKATERDAAQYRLQEASRQAQQLAQERDGVKRRAEEIFRANASLATERDEARARAEQLAAEAEYKDQVCAQRQPHASVRGISGAIWPIDLIGARSADPLCLPPPPPAGRKSGRTRASWHVFVGPYSMPRWRSTASRRPPRRRSSWQGNGAGPAIGATNPNGSCPSPSDPASCLPTPFLSFRDEALGAAEEAEQRLQEYAIALQLPMSADHRSILGRIGELQQAVQQAQHEAREAAGGVGELVADLDRTRQVQQQVQGERDSLQRALAALRSQNDQLRTELQQAAADLDRARAAARSTEASQQSERARSEAAESRASGLQQQLDTAEGRLRAQMELAERHEAAASQARIEARESALQLAAVSERLVRAEAKAGTLERALEQRTQEAQDLASEKKALTTAQGELKGQVRALEQEAQQARQQAQQLQTQVHDLRLVAAVVGGSKEGLESRLSGVLAAAREVEQALEAAVLGDRAGRRPGEAMPFFLSYLHARRAMPSDPANLPPGSAPCPCRGRVGSAAVPAAAARVHPGPGIRAESPAAAAPGAAGDGTGPGLPRVGRAGERPRPRARPERKPRARVDRA